MLSSRSSERVTSREVRPPRLDGVRGVEHGHVRALGGQELGVAVRDRDVLGREAALRGDVAHRQVLHLGHEARDTDHQQRLGLLDHHLHGFVGEALLGELLGALCAPTHVRAQRRRRATTFGVLRGLAREPHADQQEGETLVLRVVGVAAERAELRERDAVGEAVRESPLLTRLGGHRGGALGLAVASGRGVRLVFPFVEDGAASGAGGWFAGGIKHEGDLLHG